MKSSKNRNDKIQSIKIIHKAFEKYIPEKQEQMKKDYVLIIHDITRQLKDKKYQGILKLQQLKDMLTPCLKENWMQQKF